MSNSLSKLVILNPKTFEKFKHKHDDSNFLHRKLIPIYASHSLQDVNKWYQIKQEFAKYILGKETPNSQNLNQSDGKWKNLRDNETQTKRVFKNSIETQTKEKKLKSIGTQANFKLPEEIFTNETENEEDNSDLDTTLLKHNNLSSSMAAKRLKHFSNKGYTKMRKYDDEYSKLRQTMLPFRYTTRSIKNKEKLPDINAKNIVWENI